MSDACWFIFKDDQLVVIQADNTKPMDTIASAVLQGHLIRQHKVAHLNGCDIYCAECEPSFPLPETFTQLPLRKALEVLGPDWYAIGAKAYAIINWDKNHQFCGRCGNATQQLPTTFERVCPVCSLSFYPRISPSIIVLIHRDDQILMARGYHFAPTSYGLIAGFVEAGETIEDAVHRETMEEVGIKIKNLRYFGSQAWPFPDSLMMAFIAEYDSGELVINPAEIEDAGWYPVNQLPYRAATISISRKLVDHYVAAWEKTHGNL